MKVVKGRGRAAAELLLQQGDLCPTCFAPASIVRSSAQNFTLAEFGEERPADKLCQKRLEALDIKESLGKQQHSGDSGALPREARSCCPIHCLEILRRDNRNGHAF